MHFHDLTGNAVSWTMSEGCFIFHFTSLILETTRPIKVIICTNVAIKQQHLFSNVRVFVTKLYTSEGFSLVNLAYYIR